MKEIYTKKLVLFCCLFAFGVLNLHAQFDIIITSPSTEVASYNLVIGSAGTVPVDSIPGELYYQSGLSCDTVVSPDGAGKIVLIDRGTCAFVIKVEAARKAGAAAVIICNNSAAAPIFIAQAAPFNRSSIPVFMASQADCAKIKVGVTAGAVSGVIKNTGCDAAVEYDESVFWGQIPGQGDFSNGLGDWTNSPLTADEEVWVGHPVGYPEFGRFNSAGSAFNSPSFCNGVASFSFVKYGIAFNPNPVQPYHISSAELISPTIDCSGKEFVGVNFYTMNHRLNRQNMFSYSIDDGETWSEPEVIVTSNAVNAAPATERITLPLPTFTNQPKCKIKFIAEGDFYYFMLDDVTFTSKKIYNMEISNDYYAMAPNYATPFNQVEDMTFTLDIENLGNAPVDKVKVAVSVNELGNVDPVFTDTLSYGTVDVGVRDSDRIFAKKFKPEAKEGEYLISYELLGDSLENALGSVYVENDFVVSKNVFSKMPIDPNAINGWTQASGSYYSAASFYKVNTSSWPDSQPITLDKGYAGAYVNVTDPNAAFNSTVILSYDVYKWVDTNQDTFFVQPEEKTLLATGSVIIDDDVDTISIELFDPNDNTKKVVLPAGEHNLLAVVSITPIDETNTRWFIGSTNPSRGDNFGMYSSYASALGRVFNGENIWTGCFFAEGTADDIETRVLENSSLTIFNPLIFQDVELVNTVAFDASLKFKAYPVPAVQDLTVEIAFEKAKKFANILIADMTGRVVHAEKYVNVQNKNLSVDVSNFAAGVYTLQVVTDTGFNAQTFNVVK